MMLFDLNRAYREFSRKVRFDALEDAQGLLEERKFIRKLLGLVREMYVSDKYLFDNLDEVYYEMIPRYPGFVTTPAAESAYKNERAKLKGIFEKAKNAAHKMEYPWAKLAEIYAKLPVDGRSANARLNKGDTNCLVEARKIAENGNDIPESTRREIVNYEAQIAASALEMRTKLKEFYRAVNGENIPGQPFLFKR